MVSILLVLNNFWSYMGHKSREIEWIPTSGWASFSLTSGPDHLFPLGFVLVCSGCYSKNTTDWVAYKHQNLFLTVIEVGSLMLGCRHGWVRADFSLHPYMAQRTSKPPRPFLINVPILLMRALPWWPNHLPKISSPSTITYWVRISTYTFWRDTTFRL